MQALSVLFGYFPGHKIGFGDRESRDVIGDWTRILRTGDYQPKGEPVSLKPRMAQVTLPLLTLTLAGDRLAPAAIAPKFATLFPNAPKQHVHLGRSLFEGKTPGHFRWIRKPQPVAEAIRSWLEDSKIAGEEQS
jgi:predicted alpha/beta hydrolase